MRLMSSSICCLSNTDKHFVLPSRICSGAMASMCTIAAGFKLMIFIDSA